MDHGGHYPIHIAAERGYTHVISLLIDMGAFVDTTQASNGATALHLASMNGHDATVRLLLEKGAQKELEDEDGLTALELAAKNCHDSVLRLMGDHSLQPPTFSR
jgi:ankyrin repeat protein